MNKLVGRYVREVGDEHVWVDLARGLQARLHALDASADLSALQAFPGDLCAGQPLSASVLHVRSPLVHHRANQACAAGACALDSMHKHHALGAS